jgi:hypothetical protein
MIGERGFACEPSQGCIREGRSSHCLRFRSGESLPHRCCDLGRHRFMVTIQRAGSAEWRVDKGAVVPGYSIKLEVGPEEAAGHPHALDQNKEMRCCLASC